MVRLELTALKTSESARRGGIDAEHVERLAAVREELPPIIVHRPTMAVIDGRHRVRAAALRGATTITARLFQGDGDDAFVLAVRANVAHGLPLPMADRKRAAERIIASHPQWSDRMIASVTGMAPGTVAEIRRRAGGAPAAVRVGQDGRSRPVDGAERRRRASELISSNPDMSLRQVARAVGISPETVRDVRNRLHRGEDPLATGRPAAARDSAPAPAAVPLTLRAGRAAAVPPRWSADQGAAVQRLRTDPALRLSETGRRLLMLLSLHTVKPGEWEALIDGVPTHCGAVVAQLARDCAQRWAEFAVSVERQLPDAS
ncbi:ParB-like chromosome segregation protein Spo0J [Actinomadura algeriensis]|uniref:ParB-like chromosome segregation protein Spo0J n=1 Tax=Actinomadura algeriensis TaxID=1679523 RepID=A0ABR9JIV8_9ACTN|nr:ParB-like chromosome segregation protein Spo0J [Actinomadura algeriensis]